MRWGFKGYTSVSRGLNRQGDQPVEKLPTSPITGELRRSEASATLPIMIILQVHNNDRWDITEIPTPTLSTLSPLATSLLVGNLYVRGVKLSKRPVGVSLLSDDAILRYRF